MHPLQYILQLNPLPHCNLYSFAAHLVLQALRTSNLQPSHILITTLFAQYPLHFPSLQLPQHPHSLVNPEAFTTDQSSYDPISPCSRRSPYISINFGRPLQSIRDVNASPALRIPAYTAALQVPPYLRPSESRQHSPGSLRPLHQSQCHLRPLSTYACFSYAIGGYSRP